MHEKITVVQQSEILEERRLLTEVNNLLLHRQPGGAYPQEVLDGIEENLITKVKEDTMSHAVSRSFQPVSEVYDQTGEQHRTFIWKGLGKTALQVAESGFEYHWSDSAFERVKYHVKEAERDTRELAPNKWHVMIEPRMSEADAPLDIAESENLAETDAIRASHAVANENGEIIGRQMVAILASDVPLSAWVAMMRDPQNIFGKVLKVPHADSALGIIELFNQLDLPLDALPEGPVTILEAVSHYIDDETAHQSVKDQLVRFREDQQKLDGEARRTAKKWLELEKALADSLAEKTMHKQVKIFVSQHQNQWPEKVLKLLKEQEVDKGGYDMTVELAALLEQAWQKINLSETAVFVGDKKALKHLSDHEITRLQQEITFVRTIEQEAWAATADTQMARSQLQRQLAVANIQPGGGCSGENRFRFDANFDAPPDIIESFLPPGVNAEAKGPQTEDEKIGEKHMAECRTNGCPSKPGETEVGGCDVCLKHCQPLYDAGEDPAEIFGRFTHTQEPTQRPNLLDMFAIKHVKIAQKELAKV
jgi:hypothetical protein